MLLLGSSGEVEIRDEFDHLGYDISCCGTLLNDIGITICSQLAVASGTEILFNNYKISYSNRQGKIYT